MVKIGLEIHGYINTKEKLFCKCKSIHGIKFAKPNTYICPVCTAQPGAKPLLPNKSAVDKATQIALILNCKVNEKLVWQRKHYNWPDLPKGFQNTMSGPHSTPNGEKGKFEGINITECHLEEDPASWTPNSGEIDYNRSGSPLIEIVTDPDFKTSEQVIEWIKKLKATLSYIKAIDKESGLKADVNISVDGGKRIEVKNVNSLKNIQRVIEYEIKRQTKDLPKEQETRRFDEVTGTTTKMRSKENESDYRFISDPDLPAIILDKSEIQKLKKELPETPKQKLEKLIKKYSIEKKSAEVLTRKLEIVELFENIIEHTNPKLAIRWITEELLAVLNYNKIELDEINLNPKHLIELLKLIEDKTLTELKAKDILRSWKTESVSPKEFAKQNSQISDTNEIEKIAKKVISENKKAVEDYKNGEDKAINFLIGQVMKLSNKRADFKTAKEVLEGMLK
jgi:aspartyl-tRNA(Asn)/glutamyl-tRNA(Gln) amidotransferase subunit B